MPSPVIYVVAVIAGVAAGIAFKQHVYDPHLAPKFEQWSGAFTAYRRDRHRRQAVPQSHSDSDDKGGDHDHSDDKSSVELESLIEREMHTLDHNGTLRYRKGIVKQDVTEMMEKPNVAIPFTPLSPSPARSLSPPPANPFGSSSEAALPIGRLPTPVSDHTPRSSSQASSPAHISTLGRSAVSPQPTSPSILSPSSPHSDVFLSSPSSTPASQDRFITILENSDVRPLSRTSEYDTSFSYTESESRTPSLSSHMEHDLLHPNAGASRSMTPFTDPHSENSFTDEASSSAASFVDTHSQSSLDFLSSDIDSEMGSQRYGGAGSDFLHPGSSEPEFFTIEHHDASRSLRLHSESSSIARDRAPPESDNTEFAARALSSLSSQEHLTVSEAGSDDWERVSGTSDAR